MGVADAGDRAESAELVPAPAVLIDCEDWRQGDVFVGVIPFVFDASWGKQSFSVGSDFSVAGVAIASQSCDAAQRGRRFVQVAPVVRFTDETKLKEALSGRQTQYAAVPAFDAGCVVDLSGMATVSKEAFVDVERVRGLTADHEVRDYAFVVARRFGRFAFPDEVNRSLEPLVKSIRKKASAPHSPLGRALRGVHSFRIECNDWTTSPFDLVIVVVMETDQLPDDLDELEEPTEFRRQLTDLPAHDHARRIEACVKRLDPSSDELTTGGAKYFAWLRLAEEWAAQCQHLGVTKYGSTIRSITAEVVAVDEFSMFRFLNTDGLDLDYLSDSRRPAG